MTTLKRWESPRRRGRNDKGRAGTARQRQLRKRHQQLRQRLKSSDTQSHPEREVIDLSFLMPKYFLPKINKSSDAFYCKVKCFRESRIFPEAL
ncbi:hypothetical protein [Halomicronema sp. CCY15110]|uniref:hypothetical protein n=1 Tax=Halomicronema sp. CCY15110 TaxID=2767773 RepID=UPI001951985C|nr:hypothetical protein [Halomicronema sp. CCY15110]